MIQMCKMQKFICTNWLIQVQYKLILKQGRVMETVLTSQTNKENHNVSTNKELQRLRVQLNDRIFDINKLQEDYAQEKAKYSMEFQKQKLNLNRLIKELKQKNQEDNSYWTTKIDQERSNTKKQIEEMRMVFERTLKEQTKKINAELSQRFQHQITTLGNRLHTNQANYEDRVSRLQQQKHQTVVSLKISHEQQVNKRQEDYKMSLQAAKRQYENKINVLQNLYLTQQEEKTALAKKLQNYTHESIKTIIRREKQIQSLEGTILILKREIAQLKNSIVSMKESELKDKERNEERIKELNLSKMKDIKKMMEQFQIQYGLQKKYFEQQVDKIREQAKQIIRTHKQKQKKWDQRGEIILKALQSNNKKTDSFATIKNMELELLKKDRLLKRQRQNLKNCQLTLQNMEEIYDKMFVSNHYLYKSKSKSYKVKKNKVASQMHQSNSSTFAQERIYTEGDK